MKRWHSTLYGITFVVLIYLLGMNIKSTIRIIKYTKGVIKNNIHRKISTQNVNYSTQFNESRITTLQKQQKKITRKTYSRAKLQKQKKKQELTVPVKKTSLNYTLHVHKDSAYSGFDVSKVNLKFLPNFKNPCWVEKYTGDYVYLENVYLKTKKYPLRIYFGKKLRMAIPKGVKIQLESGPCAAPNKCRLRCLPYFMLIGAAKSGTSDFTNRVKVHPQIYPPVSKELYWWTQFRFKFSVLGATLGEYADLFDMSTRKLSKFNIRTRTKIADYYDSILGEFTTMTFYDFAHWRKDPQNKGQLEPKHTVAHDIYKVLPNVKLIAILRNPTARLYSSYNMFIKGKTRSPKDFHARVLGSIWWWHTCVNVKKLPERNCVYGSPPEMPPLYDLIGQRNQWWHLNRNYTGEIRHGMYGLIVKDWLDVFPRKNLLFLRMEDYSKNLKATFNDIVFPFLNVKQLDREQYLQRIEHKKVASKRNYKPMLKETKEILDNFYAPFNKRLAHLLKDTKWLWKDH